ncbi:MAG: bifunctional diaminohydroxyphosphoribosylaminopyrimidine deaminase/5-amino-6-(5-phosphoribosylamino)uracil reductase RibD [Chitinophagaceae bacterium]
MLPIFAALHQLTVAETYMRRCLQLATLGKGNVAPNPMVGAVLVHNGKIIGEGFHRQFGKPHAEVNCLQSVPPALVNLIPNAHLYVSLEPCAHYGKTPPCADLIIHSGIRQVTIGCSDPFAEVAGKGIQKLVDAGIRVNKSALEAEAISLNNRFFTFHQKNRPYIILKWAQTANGIIGSATAERLQISSAYTNRLVHRWRSEEAAILVGTNTAAADDPSLTTRLWPGKNPVRMVLDLHLRLPHTLKVFDRSVPTVIWNKVKNAEEENLRYRLLPAAEGVISSLLRECHHLQIQSVLVEGGAHLLQAFIDASVWDEARVINNTSLTVNGGVEAPRMNGGPPRETQRVGDDFIQTFSNPFS